MLCYVHKLVSDFVFLLVCAEQVTSCLLSTAFLLKTAEEGSEKEPNSKFVGLKSKTMS